MFIYYRLVYFYFDCDLVYGTHVYDSLIKVMDFSIYLDYAFIFITSYFEKKRSAHTVRFYFGVG